MRQIMNYCLTFPLFHIPLEHQLKLYVYVESRNLLFYVWSKNNISLKIFIDIESHTIVRKYVGFFYKYGCSHNPNQATSGESETRVFLLYLEFGHHLGCPSYNVARRYIHQEWGIILWPLRRSVAKYSIASFVDPVIIQLLM